MPCVEGRPTLAPDDIPPLLVRFGVPTDDLEWGALPSYEDLNFWVKTSTGKRYVLKVHNSSLPSGVLERLEAQDRLMARLREHGLPIPEVLAALGGPSALRLEPAAAGAAAPYARLLTYLEGETVQNETPKDARFLESVGELAGRVSAALSGFEDPGAHWTWDWDMKRLPEVVRGKLCFITDPARKVIAEKLACEYEDVFGGGAADLLPHTIIHADLNDTNLLYCNGEIVGILDFGDSIHSCTLFEPAIAAGYYSLGQSEPLEVFAQILRGYHRTAPKPLNEMERKAYFHAARGRILLSVAFSAEYSSLEPDNEYLAHTSLPGWTVLEKLDVIGTESALAQLERAFAS